MNQWHVLSLGLLTLVFLLCICVVFWRYVVRAVGEQYVMICPGCNRVLNNICMLQRMTTGSQVILKMNIEQWKYVVVLIMSHLLRQKCICHLELSDSTDSSTLFLNDIILQCILTKYFFKFSLCMMYLHIWNDFMYVQNVTEIFITTIYQGWVFAMAKSIFARTVEKPVKTGNNWR